MGYSDKNYDIYSAKTLRYAGPKLYDISSKNNGIY